MAHKIIMVGHTKAILDLVKHSRMQVTEWL